MLVVAKAIWIYHCDRFKMDMKQRKKIDITVLVNRLCKSRRRKWNEKRETSKQDNTLRAEDELNCRLQLLQTYFEFKVQSNI